MVRKYRILLKTFHYRGDRVARSYYPQQRHFGVWLTMKGYADGCTEDVAKAAVTLAKRGECIRVSKTVIAASLLLLIGVAGCIYPDTPPVVVPPVPPGPTEPARRAIGLIVTASGQPVVGATASVPGIGDRRTNVDGYLVFESVTFGTHHVTVRADGCQATEIDLLVDQGTLDQPVQLSCTPRRPTRAEVLRYRGCLANFFDPGGRIIWTPALPGADLETRTRWLRQLAAEGCTHIPVGPFTAGPAYPGVAWANPDMANDAGAIRSLLLEILDTPSVNGHGLVPVVFLDGGSANPRSRLTAFFPVARSALEGLWDSVLTVPAGWEPVVGDWRSSDVSFALRTWKAMAPQALIAYHGSPARLVGSSNPVEADDPWQGGESEFYKTNGGEFIDIALYQTPHGREIYEDCDEAKDGCWLNRWQDYVERIGAGINGWRKLPLVLFETCAYERFRGQVTQQQCQDVARFGDRIARKFGVPIGFGNGWPN